MKITKIKERQMKKEGKGAKKITLRDFPIVAAIGCAVLVWIVESFLHVLVFNNSTLSRQLFFPAQHELWMRLLVIIVIMLFGGYVQYAVNKRKEDEERLRNYADDLEEARNNLEQKVAQKTTELEKAQEALVRQERLAVLGQMAGSVGHELRNPFGVIKNACYFLNMKMDTIQDEAVKENIKLINQEIDIANRIISDLLDFARVKSPELKETDLNQLVKETMSGLSVPENITLSTDLAPGLAPLFIDPVQVTQIFRNLMENAVQAMPEGGSLSIATRETVAGVEVSFVDLGCGIPEEDLEKIFEPLITTKAKGIGLGLAVSKRLAAANGAKIMVESTPGQGSTFTIKFSGEEASHEK